MGAMQPAVVQFGLDQPLQVALRDVPVPEIGPADVLLAVGAASVCGSDVHQAYLTHSWPVNAPVTLGHEFGGVVAQVGADVKAFKEGDRVVSETAAYICGECLMCRTGRYNLCPTRKGFGYGIDGAMAQYVRVPARCLHHIPDTLPFDIACLTEPHCVAYQSMCVNADIKPGDLVVVLGPGPIGLLCAKMAALSGAYPLVVAGSRCRPGTSRGRARTGRDACRRRRQPVARGGRAVARSAGRRCRVRRLGGEPSARCRAADVQAGRHRREGRLVARPGADQPQSARAEGGASCTGRSATTTRCGSA